MTEFRKAFHNMKNSAQVVSLNEFKGIKEDLSITGYSLIEIEKAVITLTDSLNLTSENLKACNKELERSKRELDSLGALIKL